MARKIALLLGLFVALLPYLGFPEDLDTILYTSAGLVIAFLAWSGKRPSPPPSVEEMEGELHDATHDDVPHSHSGAMKVPPPHQSPSPSEAEGKPEHTPDTTVSVSFAKQRSRNLKKRITQEDGSQPKT